MRPPVAYIDPQSGSYIFQVVVGAFLGAAVAIRVFWRRIVNFVTRKNSRSSAGETRAEETRAEETRAEETPVEASRVHTSRVEETAETKE